MDDFSAESWNGKFGVDIPKIKLAKAWKELIEELKIAQNTELMKKENETF